MDHSGELSRGSFGLSFAEMQGTRHRAVSRSRTPPKRNLCPNATKPGTKSRALRKLEIPEMPCTTHSNVGHRFTVPFSPLVMIRLGES
jgi:hypothetical protein